MSFRCNRCGGAQPAGRKPIKKVTVVRQLQVPGYARPTKKNGEPRGPLSFKEIAYEGNFCPGCAEAVGPATVI